MSETGRKFNILIVDDMSKNIQIVANMLKEDGYHMAFARDGKTALEHTQSTQFDLILLDIMMPDMNGYEVCERLKADPATQEIPVIFLTAKTETEDIVKGFEAGAVDYVTKPFNAAELLARVETHLELRRVREEIEEQKQQLEEQNKELIEAARLREDVERITRHDLKNPLNAIIGFPQFIMKEGALSEEQVKYLRNIEESGYRILNMINLSLDLFKMEKRLYQLQPVPVDIVQVLEKISVEMGHLLQSRSLTLTVILNGNSAGVEDMFTVWGEALLCYSMLANVLKNALEASPEGECVTVTLDGEDEAIIRIHNKGIVPEQIRDRFFEKYITSGKKMKGTGLGTYSAKLIAETQGGSITMRTSETEGTVIAIRLPKSVDRESGRRTHNKLSHTEQFSIILPPKEELVALYDLAKIGDIIEIRKSLTRLEALDPQYTPFVAQLRQLADSFQIGSIREFVEKYVRGPEKANVFRVSQRPAL